MTVAFIRHIRQGDWFQDLVGNRTPYAKKPGKEILYDGYLPMRILEEGGLDLRYIPPLRDLLRLKGKFVVELANLKQEPLENFEDEEARRAAIRSKEVGIESVQRLIKKRRMMSP